VVYVVYDESSGRVRDLCVARSDLEAWQPAAQGSLPKITYADAHFDLPTNQLVAHPFWTTVESHTETLEDPGGPSGGLPRVL
jgi:hypothetical protein